MLVTHDQTEALSFADQVAVLGEGRLLQVGTPRELYLRPRNPMVAEFMGEAIVLPAQLGDGFADCALGRVPVDDRERQGPAHILLRPEQVTFAPKQGSQNARVSTSYLGQVVDIDFGGSVCSVGVHLLKATGEIDPNSPPLRLLALSIQTPQPGTVVQITLVGKAHVFPNQ
jgi:iron(III) transport system ATP-binding protein